MKHINMRRTITLLTAVLVVLCSIATSSGEPNWTQQAKLLPNGGGQEDYFGLRVSISGSTALVGAYFDDQQFVNSGAVYVYSETDTGWIQVDKLFASDGVFGDIFGSSVSISGSTAIIGAYLADAKGTNSGSAYIFGDNGLEWTEVAKLVASDGGQHDIFGRSASISGNKAIVGATGDGANGTGSGSAYIFGDNGSGWAQVAKLMASDGASNDRFGISCAISANTAIVSAPEDDDNGSKSGSAYIFADSGSGWEQMVKLAPSDGAAGDEFGYSVSISDNIAIIGAPWDDGIGADSGSAYVFADGGSGWEQIAKLAPTDITAGDNFGLSVSVSGSTAIVGARFDDDNGTDSGSAYIFSDTGSGWTQVGKLVAGQGNPGDQFGFHVSVDETKAIVGTFYDNDTENGSGSAYIFTPEPATLGILLLGGLAILGRKRS